jgi:hypothetical protein
MNKCRCTNAKKKEQCTNFIKTADGYCNVHKKCKTPWSIAPSVPVKVVAGPVLLGCKCMNATTKNRCNKPVKTADGYCNIHKNCKAIWSPVKPVVGSPGCRCTTSTGIRCNKPVKTADGYCNIHKNCKNPIDNISSRSSSSQGSTVMDWSLVSGGKLGRITSYIRKNTCNNPPFIGHYKNTKLSIDVIGLSQYVNGATLDGCIQNLVDNNVKLYITFNDQGFYHAVTIQEKKKFNKYCNMAGCNYYSIKVVDYTPPSIPTLKKFWDILDGFHKEQKLNPGFKCIMHCTAGHGRTGTMILSYIIYRKFKTDKQNTTRELLTIKNHINEFDRNNIHLVDDLPAPPVLLSTHINFYIKVICINPLIEYAFRELDKYSPHAGAEIKTMMTAKQTNLFENRIKNIVGAII